MKEKRVISMKNLRPLSQLLTPSIFRKIVKEQDYSLFQRQVSKYYEHNSEINYADLISKLYSELQSNYRCEYIFKNKLFNNILQKYSLSTTTAFNEHKIGSSKADLMLINGCIKVFEIKTELDDLSKLEKQISDYQKVADLVNIVTDAKFIKKLLAKYENTSVGIIEFSSHNSLKIHKKAIPKTDLFEYDTLFKMLHKKEYLELFYLNFKFFPDVPNTKVFRTCYELLKSLDVVVFQKQVITVLKKRKIKCPDLLKSKSTPTELKHICYTLDFDSKEYGRLYNFLNQKV